MAVTQNTYTGDGTTVLFSFTFPYLETTDIKVTLNGVITTAYTFANATTIQFNTAPTLGTAIRIYRDTDDADLSATFYPGSAIRSQDLNDNFTQNLYSTQEVKARYLDRQSGAMEASYVPTTSTSLITKGYMETQYGVIDEVGFTRWRQVATSGQTVFSGAGSYGNVLSFVPTREQVYLNGALQQINVDYTTNTAGSTITFSPGLTAGDVVDVVCINNLVENSTTNSDDLTFVQAGTGAVTRTVGSKLRDVVSVKDFGAVGDGVTDDTAAIQVAVNAAGVTNTSVYLPAGIYKVTSQIDVNDAVRIYGDGQGLTKLVMAAASGTNLLSIESTDVIVEDLTLDVTRSSGSGSVTAIRLNGSDVSRFRLSNTYIKGNVNASTSVTQGITFNDAAQANNCLIDNVYFKEHNFALFTTNSFGTTGNKAKHWVIRNCTVDAVKRGFSFNSDFATSSSTDAWQHVIVDSCTFINTSPDYDRCTSVGGDSCLNLTVSNCVFKDRPGTDGVIHIENYMDNAVITGNTVYNCGGGIVLYPLSSRFVVDSNNITIDPTVSTTPTPAEITNQIDNSGITLVSDVDGQPSNASVTNNVIYGAQAGISCAANLNNNSSISNNRVVRCVAGLRLLSNTARCTLDNNTYVSCGNGIQAQGTSNTVIQYAGYQPRFQLCTNPIITYGAGTTAPLAIDSPVFTFELSHPGSSTVAHPFCLAPLLAKGICHIIAKANTEFYATSTDLVIDDAPTFTAVRNGNISNGSVAIGDPTFDTNSGQLRLRVFSSAALNFSFTVAFAGYVYYDV